MPTITSNGTGSWATGGTWVGGTAPGNGDSAVIATGHTVTIAASTSVTVGTSPATGGTAAVTINGTGKLVMGDGSTLVCRGDLLLGATATSRTAGFYQFDVGAGCVFEFDASQATTPLSQKYVCGPVQSNSPDARVRFAGTSGSHTAVRSNASGGNGWFSVRGFNTRLLSMVATYTDFLRVGDATNNALEPYLSGTGGEPDTFDLSDCTLTSCGRIEEMANVNAGATFSLLRVKFTSTAAATPVLVSGVNGTTTGTHRVQGCSFDKQPTLQDMDGWTIGHATDATLGNYFHNGLGVTGNKAVAVCRKNFVRITALHGLNGDFQDNYVFWDGPTDINPDMLQPVAGLPAGTYALAGSVFEFNGTSATGDAYDAVAGASTNAVAFNIHYNLVLPNPDYPTAGWQPSGKLFGALGGTNQTYSIRHNTCPLGGDTPVYVGDAFNPASGFLSELRSNLFWDTSVRTPVLYNRHDGGSDNGDVVSPANCDYNCVYNADTSHGGEVGTGTAAGTVYVCLMSGSAPGTHDVNANPAFYDPSRRLRTWGAVRRGTDGTDATALAALQADPTLTGDLMAWVKAGWAPTNVLLQAAAHDGTTPGAVEGQFVQTPLSGRLGGEGAVHQRDKPRRPAAFAPGTPR